MARPAFTFQPFPRGLYDSEALLAGFDPDRPGSYAEMSDTRIYQEFVTSGGAACSDHMMAMARALHDNAITQSLAQAVGDERVVAIMGGHGVSRRDSLYAETARLAARLTTAGFTVASGGGPGVMEATHLGAVFGAREGLDEALDELAADATPPTIPANAGKLIAADGSIDPAIAEALGAFLAPAVRIAQKVGRGGLAIPTWLYGHEPTSPFAQSIAKYFQNSIREDGLLALATSGIIYMPGSAGTLQEVFQDAAQNYYKTFPTGPGKVGEFSPMVFYGSFWTKQVRVRPVLRELFGKPAAAPQRNVGNDFADWVRFVSDIDRTIEHLQRFSGQPNPTLRRLREATALQGPLDLSLLMPATVLVSAQQWQSGAAMVACYPDQNCVDVNNEPEPRPRNSLHPIGNLPAIPNCDGMGTQSMIRCTVH